MGVSAMKKLLGILMVFIALLFSQKVKADGEIEYRIVSYEGDLRIHEDNRATFKQEVTYEYESLSMVSM